MGGSGGSSRLRFPRPIRLSQSETVESARPRTSAISAAVFALIAYDPAPVWVDVLVYVAVAATVLSGADYFFGLRSRIEQQQRERAAASPQRAT